jgi:hypothetical protein
MPLSFLEKLNGNIDIMANNLNGKLQALFNVYLFITVNTGTSKCPEFSGLLSWRWLSWIPTYETGSILEGSEAEISGKTGNVLLLAGLTTRS